MKHQKLVYVLGQLLASGSSLHSLQIADPVSEEPLG